MAMTHKSSVKVSAACRLDLPAIFSISNLDHLRQHSSRTEINDSCDPVTPGFRGAGAPCIAQLTSASVSAAPDRVVLFDKGERPTATPGSYPRIFLNRSAQSPPDWETIGFATSARHRSRPALAFLNREATGPGRGIFGDRRIGHHPSSTQSF